MLDAYLTDTVTIRRTGGLDADNERQAPTDETDVRARFTFQTRIVRDVTGEQVVSSGNVLLKTEVTHADQIVYNGAVYSIAAIERMRQFSAGLGWKVYVL